MSPFWYADLGAVLIFGVDPLHLAILGVVIAAATVLGMLAFERREIDSQRWQFPLRRQ